MDCRHALIPRRPTVIFYNVDDGRPGISGSQPDAYNFLFGALYPVYVRGLALAASGQPAQAAAEFQKILDRYDQDVSYLNSEDYAKLVRKIYDEEGAVIKRMGLKL
mgnify:CR=1 FL=1